MHLAVKVSSQYLTDFLFVKRERPETPDSGYGFVISLILVTVREEYIRNMTAHQ